LSSSFNPISSGIFAFSKLDCAREDRLAVTEIITIKISYVHHGMIIKYRKSIWLLSYYCISKITGAVLGNK
jgi:hypothetical protein